MNNNQSVRFQAIFFLYQVLRQVRYGILMSSFGFVSHCQQNPTCGSFFLLQCRRVGLLRAAWVTVPRVLLCGVSTHKHHSHIAHS